MVFTRKDFLSLEDVSAEEILFILNTADTMKYVLMQKNKRVPHLQGKSVITLFYEKNSKTKLSYELAAGYMSATVVDMDIVADDNIIDMGRIIDQMGGDFIIMRHPVSGSSKLLAENVSASVINAGDGSNENPSQSLLDLMTIKTKKGGFKNLNVAIVGDIIHSRVTRSNIYALLKLGANVSVAGPPTLIPPQLDRFGVKVFFSADEAVKAADVIMVTRMPTADCYGRLIPSLNEYKNLFIIDERMVQRADSDVIVMHPGPISRGIEISCQVIESRHCLVNNQIANGVVVRMALLYLMSIKGGVPA